MTAPAPAAGTVADLVDHWSAQRHAGNYSPATVSAYLGAIARILGAQDVPGTALLDELDLPALLATYEAAHPDLKASTLSSVAASLRAALSGYRARHKPSLTEPFTPPSPEPVATVDEVPQPAPESADVAQFDGTLAHLPEFAERAGRSGLINPTTARLLAEAVRRILTDAPEFAATPAASAEPDVIMNRFIERNPGLKTTTTSAYASRLMRGITAYLAYLADPNKPAPAPRRTPGRNSPRATEIPLPGGRHVTFAAPADLTHAEAAATGALLRLYHPAMFTPASAPPPTPSAENTWTLVFWPESAPDEPEAAHLTGPSFCRALADHIRTRCPEFAGYDDEDAIDAWYATEVFVALAFDGHHHARDSGTLLRPADAA